MADSWSDLIERARGGDRGAIDVLMARHLDALHAYVHFRMGPLLRSRETSVDLVQSVCRELIADLPRFEASHESGFRHWLFRRAERKLGKRARFWRCERRDAARETPLDAERGPAALARAGGSPAEHAIAAEQIERLEQAFARLRPRDARVILLTRLVGLPHATVARTLGLTEEATWSLLHRALARLTTLLAADDA